MIKLVIFSQGSEKKYAFEEIKRLNGLDGVRAADNVKPRNLFLRMLRRFHFLSKLPGIGIWLEDWKKLLPECDTLICMANVYSAGILSWVKKHYPTVRCINYFWDELNVSGYSAVKSEDFENWSFCRRDCERFGLNYNPQFYVNSSLLPEVSAEYDVIFVGTDKGGRWKFRTAELNKFIGLIKKENLSSYIWYISDDPNVSKEYRKDRRFSREEYSMATAKAKAVLELVDPDHPWITQRSLYALSNGKKLITNSVAVMEEKYYSAANVFILGRDPADSLKEFVNSPFEKIPEDALHYYEASEWIKRFEQ